MEQGSGRELVSLIFQDALKAADPYESVTRHADLVSSVYRKGGFKKIVVAAFGKAACLMAGALEDRMGSSIEEGIAVTKYGHTGKDLKKFRVYEAGHPVPDEKGVAGTEEVIRLLKEAGEDTLVVCLVSGGGSALLVAPLEAVRLAEKQEITRLLLRSGADIQELNAVRKHLSRVKGGRLAELAFPAVVMSLILSDVIGDRLDVIASGPTAPDKTTYRDALDVLEKYGLTEKIPPAISTVIQKGVNGLIPDTPKAENKVFAGVQNIIIGSNKKALDSAKEKAESLDLCAEITSAEISGEARQVAAMLAQQAKEIRNQQPRDAARCLLSGGETTVTVKGSGLGGRNMELALAFALEIDGVEGITLLSAGTDGTDGPTDAAGAIVDGKTIGKARALGLSPEEFLENNDSYTFFSKTGELLITGPTGTNVMDLQIMLIE